jgi:predicted metal-dependent phosphoesterase TrpH
MIVTSTDRDLSSYKTTGSVFSEMSERLLKADLHCHSYFSGKTAHVKLLEPMDSYSSPETIYRLAKKRGMDLVTITDHDSIEGCLHLLNKDPDKLRDFIIGEEVTCPLPEFQCKIHIAVYDINEEQHREITRLKQDFNELMAYLHSQKILHGLNHLLFEFPPPEHARAFVEKMLANFVLFEGWNGAIGSRQNELVSRVLRRVPGKILIGGSDAHTLLRLASSYTLAPGRDKKEFLESIRQGKTSIRGKDGYFFHVFYDAMGVYLNYFGDVAFRNEVHRAWSTYKKMRNSFGWAFYLPVWFVLSLSYTFFMCRLTAYRHPYHESLLNEIVP